jgi:hypothetical protein
MQGSQPHFRVAVCDTQSKQRHRFCGVFWTGVSQYRRSTDALTFELVANGSTVVACRPDVRTCCDCGRQPNMRTGIAECEIDEQRVDAIVWNGEVLDASGSSFANTPHRISESGQHCYANCRVRSERSGRKRNCTPPNFRSRIAKCS